MLIYYCLYALLFITAFVCFKTEAFRNMQKAKKAFCIIGFIALGLLMALRHPSMGIDVIGTGGEEIGYVGTYPRIAKFTWGRILTKNYLNYQKGYVVFCKLLSYVSKDSQFLIAVCAIIQVLSLFYLIYKNSKKPMLSLVVYLALPCFFIHFSGLRQSIAISITMIAFIMIKEKKPIKFILLVVLAWLFHSSAIIFLIAYPLYHLKMSSIWKLVSVITIPLVYIFRESLFKALSVILKDNAEITDTGALTLFLVFVAMYIFLIFFGNSKNKQLNGCTNLFWVACLVQAFSGLYDTAMRVGYYFMLYAIIAIPEIVSDEDENSTLNYQYKSFVSMVLFLVFISYGIYTIYNGQIESWFRTNPYKFFWK